MGKKQGNVKDLLLEAKPDRRKLANVPDKRMIRTSLDRRGSSIIENYDGNAADFIKIKKAGTRYNVNYAVELQVKDGKKNKKVFGTAKDISTTGMLLEVNAGAAKPEWQNIHSVRIKFEITPGSMPEGYEMKVHIKAVLVRVIQTADGKLLLGVEFEHALSEYANRKRGRYALTVASILLFVICSFIILMRAESIIYFKFNKWLYLYSIIAAVFLLTRYLFGACYKAIPINKEYTPGVTVIIPCFNEEEWIQRTIMSCINQDYPVDKLEVIVVDDHSADRSVEKIQEIIEELKKEGSQFELETRLKYVVQEKNAGKREALCKGAVLAKHDLVVFVDSDSFLDPFAIRNLVQPFQDPKMGGVSGRTDVANTYTNALTKMQSVRYYIAFRVMKAAEACFDGVTCLSGPLACYKKEIILDNMEAWLHQKFLGQKATFGDDRSMTNFVLRHHRTSYQDTAICSTIVPNKYNVFLKQQMRWKRSWLRESIVAGKFIWKKEPFMSLFFYIGMIVPIAAPIVVLYNLIWVPITQRVFPITFLIGMLLMSLLMSVAQLLLRKSTTWLFGMLFCFYYEVVLLWQMPIAWFTFWKSTWGTRMTPEDIRARDKKRQRRMKKASPDDASELNPPSTGPSGCPEKIQENEIKIPAEVLALGRQADAMISAYVDQGERKKLEKIKKIKGRKAGKLQKREAIQDLNVLSEPELLQEPERKPQPDLNVLSEPELLQEPKRKPQPELVVLSEQELLQEPERDLTLGLEFISAEDLIPESCRKTAAFVRKIKVSIPEINKIEELDEDVKNLQNEVTDIKSQQKEMLDEMKKITRLLKRMAMEEENTRIIRKTVQKTTQESMRKTAHKTAHKTGKGTGRHKYL